MHLSQKSAEATPTKQETSNPDESSSGPTAAPILKKDGLSDVPTTTGSNITTVNKSRTVDNADLRNVAQDD